MLLLGTEIDNVGVSSCVNRRLLVTPMSAVEEMEYTQEAVRYSEVCSGDRKGTGR